VVQSRLHILVGHWATNGVGVRKKRDGFDRNTRCISLTFANFVNRAQRRCFPPGRSEEFPDYPDENWRFFDFGRWRANFRTGCSVLARLGHASVEQMDLAEARRWNCEARGEGAPAPWVGRRGHAGHFEIRPSASARHEAPVIEGREFTMGRVYNEVNTFPISIEHLR